MVICKAITSKIPHLSDSLMLFDVPQPGLHFWQCRMLLAPCRSNSQGEAMVNKPLAEQERMRLLPFYHDLYNNLPRQYAML